MQYRSRTDGAPVPAPGDRHGLPAAKSPSDRPRDSESLIRTLFYYSPEEIAAIRDFERRAREWKLFIADDSYDEGDESEDEGAHIRAAYAAAREDLREASEATQPLGEREGLDWSDEDGEEVVDLVGEAQARFRSWDENANKSAAEENEQAPPVAHPSGNATPQGQEASSNAITNDSAAQNAVDHSANATPQAQEDLLDATSDNIAARDAVESSLNATPQAQEVPSSATTSTAVAGDAVHLNIVAPAYEQDIPSSTTANNLANGDAALPQMPPTPRLEGLDHVSRAEKRRSQSPPEREGSSGRVKLMETIAEGEEQGNGTESESETPTSSEAESEAKEMEER